MSARARLGRIERAVERPRGGLGEALHHRVEVRAALQRVGLGRERVERAQAQDLGGVDRVGVAQQRLDPRHRQARRPRARAAGGARGGARGARGARSGRPSAARPASQGCARSRICGEPRRAALRRQAAEQVQEAVQPARRAWSAPRRCGPRGSARPRARWPPAGSRARARRSAARAAAGPPPRAGARLSQGSAAAAVGQVPSLSPARITRSAPWPCASWVPQISTRGWPRSGRRTSAAPQDAVEQERVVAGRHRARRRRRAAPAPRRRRARRAPPPRPRAGSARLGGASGPEAERLGRRGRAPRHGRRGGSCGRLAGAREAAEQVGEPVGPGERARVGGDRPGGLAEAAEAAGREQRGAARGAAPAPAARVRSRCSAPPLGRVAPAGA